MCERLNFWKVKEKYQLKISTGYYRTEVCLFFRTKNKQIILYKESLILSIQMEV